MWIDDEIIENCHEDLVVKVWIPDAKFVVMGSGNKAETECHSSNCDRDGVPILKRYGGGGTVLLYPGCVVVGIGTWVRRHFHNDIYFRMINEVLIDALADQWPMMAKLQQRGISDLAFNDRKVCGTSMFRSRNYLLYQASLLVEDDLTAISSYLAHPSKEPDYRQGKSHSDFLTTLNSLVPDITASAVAGQFEQFLRQALFQSLRQEQFPPDHGQIIHMKKRAATGREECDESGRSQR